MLQFQEYSSAWLIYALAAIGILVVVWRLCRIFPWAFVRRVLLLSITVLVFTPVLSELNYWSRAWIVSILELLFGGLESAQPALMILLKVWLAVMVIFTVFTLLQQGYSLFSKSGQSSNKRRHRQPIPPRV